MICSQYMLSFFFLSDLILRNPERHHLKYRREYKIYPRILSVRSLPLYVFLNFHPLKLLEPLFTNGLPTMSVTFQNSVMLIRIWVPSCSSRRPVLGHLLSLSSSSIQYVYSYPPGYYIQKHPVTLLNS